MAKKRVHLPEEVINEILLRLPVKYVLRCKCVCSCRGFLLLECQPYLYIWNPSTCVNKRIPLSPLTFVSRPFKLLYGFGYDMSNDDYMVVVGSYKYNYIYPPVPCSVDLEIFSLRANEWEQLEFDSDLLYRTVTFAGGPIVGSFLNGSIHWLVYNYETKMDVIIAFDLKEMTMSEIALPDYFYSDVSHSIFDLLAFDGLIGVWSVEMYTNTIKIWVMQEYDVHSSWTKTYDFSFHHAPDFSPLCFTNCGDVVGPVVGGGLAKLDDKGELLEYHSNGDRNFERSEMVVYTESLLSLSGGTEQA